MRRGSRMGRELRPASWSDSRERTKLTDFGAEQVGGSQTEVQECVVVRDVGRLLLKEEETRQSTFGAM